MAETSEKTRGELIIGEFNSTDTLEQTLIKSHAMNLIDVIDKLGKDERRNEMAIKEIAKAVMIVINPFVVV